MITIALEDDAFVNPHQRCRQPWVARIWGKNAPTVERLFLRQRQGIVDATPLTEGDALEFSEDVDKWRKKFIRHYYIVEKKSLNELVLRPVDTLSQALRFHREFTNGAMR